MTSPEMKKAPVAPGASKSDPIVQEGEQTMSSISHPSDNFDALFTLLVGRTRVWVQPASRPNGESVIELTDDLDSNLLMKPTEALAVAAALQAVSVHILEAESKLGVAK